jgi:pimeloyl-ACP methyl ester carboxylesterase
LLKPFCPYEQEVKQIKPLAITLVVAALLAPVNASRTDCDLRSRGLAGFGYRDLTEVDRDSLNLPDLEGIVVIQIVPDSPAERAGIVQGDIITRFDATSVADGSDLISLLRSFYQGDSVVVGGLRDDHVFALPLIFDALPRERGDDIEIEYTCFESDGVRLRAVLASPLNSTGKRLPAVLIVSALGSPRFSGLPYYSMGREMAHAIARNGFRVLRFELRGVGDSEGEDYRTTDFMTEAGDNLAGLDYLMGRPDTDEDRVFVMGHSTGGMVAAVVASQREFAGLIVSCTVGRTFYERMFETLRFQAEMGGDSPEVIDMTLKNYLELMVGVARGDSLGGIVRRNEDIGQFVNTSGRIMDDRNTDYWRQQLNLNLSETYSKVCEPTLIIYAASDFLTQLACHEHIRDVLTASGNKAVRLAVIPDCDHAYSYAKDKKESYAHYQTRDFTGNPEPINQIITWLKEARTVD